MYDNFQALTGTFGHENAGCDVCAANLVRFWCYFTCAPNQGDFMVPLEQANVTDPVTNVTYLVLNINVTIDSDLACEVYQSCKSVPMVTEIPSAESSLGLFSFLGTSGEAQGHVYINVALTEEDDKGLTFNTTPHQCTDTFNGTDSFGYPIPDNCTCANCEQLCTAFTPGIYGELFAGSQMSTVAIVYIAILVLTVILSVMKAATKRIPTDDSENSRLIDNSISQH